MICRKCKKQTEDMPFGYCRDCARNMGAKFKDEKIVKGWVIYTDADIPSAHFFREMPSMFSSGNCAVVRRAILTVIEEEK